MTRDAEPPRAERPGDTIRLWLHALADGEIEVPDDWLSDLAAEELELCRRFRRAADRLAYAAAHALLYRALAQTLGVARHALRLTRDALGRPGLAAPAGSGIDFNLSHTDGLVAVAISRAGRVGVDVEGSACNRPALACLYGDATLHELRTFGLGEAAIDEIAALPEALREEYFLDWWTLREAVAKADGRGLSLPFAAISVDPQRRLARLDDATNAPAQRWRLWRAAPTPHHRLALACANEDARLVHRATLL